MGDHGGPYNVFEFTLNRGRDGPKYFLQDYREVPLADAYAGYNGVVTDNEIRHAGCWAHARRKIVEAEKPAPAIAREAVKQVRALYAVERQAKELSAAARLQLRQSNSAPLLAKVREKLLGWKEQLLPKRPMAKAGSYILGQREERNAFCRDGAVPIDNNASDREMKRVVPNRKNPMFVGSARGGRTVATLASLTSSCRRHDVDPQLYLTQLLMNLPSARPSDLAARLPAVGSGISPPPGRAPAIASPASRPAVHAARTESKRPSELADYATSRFFASDFLETALAMEDSSIGIWRWPITLRNWRSATSRPEPTQRSI